MAGKKGQNNYVVTASKGDISITITLKSPSNAKSVRTQLASQGFTAKLTMEIS